jgi:hypothetical protein
MRRRTHIRLRHAATRLALYLLFPAALVAATRLLWGLESAHRLDRTRAALRAQSVPTDIRDFAGPEIPDDQNALAPLLDTMNTVSLSTADEHLVNGYDVPNPVYEADYTPAQLADIDRILASLQPLFESIDAAAARPAARWNPAFYDPAAPWLTIRSRSPLTFLRTCAKIATLAARRDLVRHDTRAFFHHVEQVFTLARIADGNPTLLGHLITVSIRSLAAQALEHFLLALDLAPADAPAARALLHALLDEASARAAHTRAFQWEVAAMPLYARAELPAMKSWVLQPLADHQLNTLTCDYAAYLPAAASPAYDPALFPPAPSSADNPLAQLCPLPGQAGPSFGRTLLLYHRALADTRAAAILLAARLYLLENGRPAQSLADLAPLLPAPPADPFSTAGAPLHYRLDPPAAPGTPPAPTVWSIGENALDDNAAFRPLADPHRQRYEQPDITYGAAWRAYQAAINASSPTRPAP